ncbi:hypothetical protein BC829DRAFT_398143 [Chytridium lagenaria]|nr:hypothetical protein BC829DRAFT_398143 [Chytridium lagenaria]
MLLRSGVQRLRLIDFDQVSLSSLNRHAVARRSDVGSPKALCLAKHFNEIFPDTIIEPIVRLFDLKAADTLLEGNPDYVLADPSHIQIADLSETFEDPLARSTRKGLKLKGIDGGVPVVYSTEKPGTVKLLPLEGEKVEEANEYGPLPNFRARILPVLGTLPALFGNAMASFVITELAGFATHPLRVKQRTKVYERILKDLKQEVLKKRQSVVNDAKKKGVEAPPEDESELHLIFITVTKYSFLVYKGRSLLSGSVEKDKVTLVRWNPSLPQCPSNMVCMTRIEADRHVAAWQGGDAVKWLEERYEKEVLEKVKNRVNEVRQAEKWRG